MFEIDEWEINNPQVAKGPYYQMGYLKGAVKSYLESKKDRYSLNYLQWSYDHIIALQEAEVRDGKLIVKEPTNEQT